MLGGGGFAQAVPFQNGDFSAGFAGWDGEIFDSGTGDYVPADPASLTANFQLPASGGARITTTDAIESLFLFQTFDLPADALSIAFDYGWSLTDETTDLVQALLIYGSGLFDWVDLFADAGVDTQQPAATGSTGAIDLSAYAGNMGVTLEFFVDSFDAVEGDYLDIDNIIIRTASTPVPATPTLWLLVLWLPLAAVAGVRQARRHRAVRGPC